MISSAITCTIQSATSLYGKITKFLLIDSKAVAIIQRLHGHQWNICKEGHHLPTLPFLKQLVRDNALAYFYIPVEMVDEVYAIYCSKISRKCFFVGDKEFVHMDNVCGFLVPDLKDYRV